MQLKILFSRIAHMNFPTTDLAVVKLVAYIQMHRRRNSRTRSNARAFTYLVKLASANILTLNLRILPLWQKFLFQRGKIHDIFFTN
jgi:hypothetical protein